MSPRPGFWLLLVVIPLLVLSLILIFRRSPPSNDPTPSRKPTVTRPEGPPARPDSASLPSEGEKEEGTTSPIVPAETPPAAPDKPVAVPPHLKFGKATRFGGWKEFYETANALGISFKEMRSLVFQRLEKELKLSDDEFAAMYKLVQDEEEAVTKHVYAKYGNRTQLMTMMNVSPAQKTAILADIRSIRDSVRKTFDPRIAETFTEEKVKAINERLRGESLLFNSENGKESIGSIPGYME